MAERHKKRQGSRDQIRIRQSPRVQRSSHLLQQPIHQGRPGEFLAFLKTIHSQQIMHVLKKRQMNTRNGERPIKGIP